MKKAYASSGKIFNAISMRQAPLMHEQLRAIKGGEVVAVQGTYDHIETLLETLKVPYELIQPDQIASHNGGRVMFVNCRMYDEGKAVDGARAFVASGGRLVTTDWSLSLVTQAFPGKLSKTKVTSDDVVEVRPDTDNARRWLGLNYAQCRPKWWLEGSSHIYKAEGVTSLISSQEMEDKYGQPSVCVGFAEGKGEVVHFISHLELQRTQLRTKEDEGGLDDFLKKMGGSNMGDLEEASVAELEAAYSTLNTVAHLCVPTPVIATTMNSMGYNAGGAKSQPLV